MTQLPPVVSREECAVRLRRLFPPDAVDAMYSSPAAAAVVASLLYVGATSDQAERSGRPSTVFMCRDGALERFAIEDREAYFAAALGPNARGAIDDLMSTWRVTDKPWYGDNSRETIREVLTKWRDHGAVVERPGLAVTSSQPRWQLETEFAVLFDPDLVEEAFADKASDWLARKMKGPAALRAHALRVRATSAHAVRVELPGTGAIRQLEPSDSSLIIKAVIEDWANGSLGDPFVISISQPGDKIPSLDREAMAAARLEFDASKLLPDVLIADLGGDEVQVWAIEVVASDGPIDERRRSALVDWGREHGLEESQMHFLTAFASRAAPIAKRRFPDLAVGSHAWFADEPGVLVTISQLEVPRIAPIVDLAWRGPGRSASVEGEAN